jgi:hypothetical protein
VVAGAEFRLVLLGRFCKTVLAVIYGQNLLGSSLSL